jgi:peroxiredoxin
VDGSRVGTERFLKRLRVTFPVLIDETGEAADAYRVSGLPAGFLIGREGVILQTYRGFERAMIPLMEKDVSDQLKN